MGVTQIDNFRACGWGPLRTNFRDPFALYQNFAGFHDASACDVEQTRGMQHDGVSSFGVSLGGGGEGAGQQKRGRGREEVWLFHGCRKGWYHSERPNGGGFRTNFGFAESERPVVPRRQ